MLQHRQAMPGFQQHRTALVRRVVTGHKQHLGQIENLHCVLGKDKVTNVNGIEGPTKNPKPGLRLRAEVSFVHSAAILALWEMISSINGVFRKWDPDAEAGVPPAD
jgi:hypothetical protein